MPNAKPTATERLRVSREPKKPGNEEGRGRSGAGLSAKDRRRTRDGPTSGKLKTRVGD